MLSDAATEAFETAADLGDGPLVDACRQGSSAAWRNLYDTHFDFAYRNARRLGASEAEAEDVVHEAFEVALKKLDAFKGGQFSTWLYRIVANVVGARLRRTRVRSVFAALFSSSDEPEEDSLESALDARRQLAKVQAVLRDLSNEKREVFALHELEGLSHEQISQLTGVKVETVRTRLHYAKKDFEALARKRGLLP